MTKRITALLLALLMVIGTVPAPAFATDSSNAPEEASQTICSVCNLTDCTVTHVQCEKCGNYDCTTDHTNWCDTCKKDNRGVDHSAGTETTEATDSTCATCGTANCTADHTNWCDTCKKDNCGVDHSTATVPPEAADTTCVTCGAANCTADHSNWCATCKKDDCGVDHGTAANTTICEVCGNEVCTCEPAVDNCAYCAETIAEDGTVTHEATCNTNYKVDANADVGKTAAFSMVYNPALYSAEQPAAGFDYDDYDGSSDFLEAAYNYDDAPLVEITNWYWEVSGAALWYQVKPLDGETLPEGITEESWIFQKHTNEDDSGVWETLVITSLDMIGKTVAFNEGSANLYDGIEGNVLAADTTILSTMVIKDLYTDGTSTWYYVDAVEGETWPTDYADYHHVAATDVAVVEIAVPETPELKEDTFTPEDNTDYSVSGNLPVGGKVTVDTFANEPSIMEELGIEQGFLADIKVLDTDGNEWQPAAGEKITITMKTENTYYEIIHFLGNVDAIMAGIENGTVGQVAVPAEASAGLKALLAPAITAWQSATGSTEEKVAVEIIKDITFDETKGTITFDTTGFSVYIGAAGTGEITGAVNMSTYNGDTLYVTPGSTVTLSTGRDSGNSLEWTSSNTGAVLTNQQYSGATLTIGQLAVGTKFTITYERTYTQVFWTATDTFTVTFEVVPVVTFNGNGGTVDTNNQATYVKGAQAGTTFTLPTATHPDGKYFDGWYTAPEGGTRVGVRDDNASVSNGHLVFNYTVTENVTLYAHWTASAEVSGYTNIIEFGLINAYYMDDGYVISGTSYDSLGQFPKEPNVVEHPVQNGVYSAYRVDDSNGYSLNTQGFYPLVGAPSDYIDESIMDSSLLQTTVSGNNETSLGLADETGALVRQFIKPGAIDDDALIRAWLSRLITNKDSGDWFAAETVANIENVFNIDLPDTADGLTDAHINEFNLIPYVIKRHVNRYGDISTWIIDMVVVPANHYTLSYNMSPPAGYTSPVGGWDTIETHKAGTTASVHSGPPTGYVLTNGDYTATFLYWTDEYGNKYGKDYDLDILMDSDKVLTAYWSTNEKDPGTLKVTKKVTAVEGNQLPSTTPTFTFTYSIDTTSKISGAVDPGSYSYTIYNAAGIAQSTKTFTALTGTFQLNDGWYIIMTGLPAGSKVTVTETVVSPYIPDPSSLTMTIHAVQETSATFLNAYPLARYTVEHYLQPDNLSADLSQYVKQEDDTQTLVGTVGELTEATANSYDGYTAVTPITQVKVLADDSAVVKIYYNHTPYTLTINHVEQGNPSNVLKTETETVQYGDTINSSDKQEVFAGYTYVSAAPKTVVVDGNETITLYYTRNTYSYTVKYWDKDTDKEIRTQKVVNDIAFGTVIESAEEVVQIENYQYDSAEKESITIAVNGNVINLYYTRIETQYKVEHYLQNLDGTYPSTPYEAETITEGVYAGHKTTATSKEYTGFTVVTPIEQTTIKADGSTVVKIYYTRNTYSYTVNYLEKGTSNVLAEAKTVDGVAYGKEITEEAITIESYTYDSTSDNTLTISTTGNVINLYYTRDTGSLTITKNVEEVETGTNTPEVTKFQFTIAFPTGVTPAAFYAYGVKDKAGNVVKDENGNDVWTAEVSGTAMVIALENGQTATFTNLPVGSYTVTETDYSAQGYDSNYKVNDAATYTTGNTAGVAVTKNTTQTVEFKNKFPVGDLVIEKTVTKEFYGTQWSGDTFTFTVERTTEGRPLIQNNQYEVYLDGVKQANPAVVDANGNLTVTISFDAEDAAKLDEESEKNESVVHTLRIENLPAGTYSVTEDADTAYTQSPTDLTESELTIPAKNVTASFENTLKRKTGGLTLEKELEVLEGYQPPTDVTKFSFTIELLEGVPTEDKTFEVTYSPTQYTDQTATATSITMSQGKFTVTLEANQKVTINGLPEGEYRITEATVPYYANAFAHKENGSWVVQSSTATGDGQMYTEIDVPANGTAEVKCTNTYPVDRAELIIQKLVKKKYERDTLPDTDFIFTVTLAEEDKDSYSYTIYNSDGTVDTTSSGTAPVTNNAFTVTLEAGQYVVIPDMPVCGYTVSENVDTTDYNASYKVYVSETGESASTQVNTTGTVNTSGTGVSVSRTFSAGKTDSIVFTNEYKQHLGTLTIIKTANGGSAGDTFIFHIKGTDANNSYIDMDVTITGSNSITIYDLPLGNYTVTEDTAWSWRYTAAATSASASLTVDSLDATVEFTNTYTENRWLNYTAYMPNEFGKKENE